MKPFSLFSSLNRLVGWMTGGGSGRAGAASLDRGAFLDAMAMGVHGVAIVTTDGPGGRFGLTVTSQVSASADPPLVLVCVNRRSPVAGAIVRNGRFCVNLLATRHCELADTFAGRPAVGKAYDFGLVRWLEGDGGAPVLEDAVAHLECVLHERVPAGTHDVLIGRCVGAGTAAGPALLHTGRRYGFACTWPDVTRVRGGESQRPGGPGQEEILPTGTPVKITRSLRERSTV